MGRSIRSTSVDLLFELHEHVPHFLLRAHSISQKPFWPKGMQINYAECFLPWPLNATRIFPRSPRWYRTHGAAQAGRSSDSFGETQQRRKDFLPALLASLGVSTEVEARLSLLISCLEHCASTSRLAQRIGLRKIYENLQSEFSTPNGTAKRVLWPHGEGGGKTKTAVSSTKHHWSCEANTRHGLPSLPHREITRFVCEL